MSEIELITKGIKVVAVEGCGRWVVNTYRFSKAAGHYAWNSEVMHKDFSVAWREAIANIDLDLYFAMYTEKEDDAE